MRGIQGQISLSQWVLEYVTPTMPMFNQCCEASYDLRLFPLLLTIWCVLEWFIRSSMKAHYAELDLWHSCKFFKHAFMHRSYYRHYSLHSNTSMWYQTSVSLFCILWHCLLSVVAPPEVEMFKIFTYHRWYQGHLTKPPVTAGVVLVL